NVSNGSNYIIFETIIAGNQLNSTVQSLSHGGVTFDLQLLPSPDKSDRPHQNWLVTSTTMLKNYCGDLVVILLPCFLTFTHTSTQPISCSPSDHVTFSLPIKLQQVSDPVPAKFSLNRRCVAFRETAIHF
ncbi:FREM2-like protein, partial [Mya arenaria]